MIGLLIVFLLLVLIFGKLFKEFAAYAIILYIVCLPFIWIQDGCSSKEQTNNYEQRQKKVQQEKPYWEVEYERGQQIQRERGERIRRWQIKTSAWREELRLESNRMRNKEANDNAWLDRQNQKIIDDWRKEEGQPNPYRYGY